MSGPREESRTAAPAAPRPEARPRPKAASGLTYRERQELAEVEGEIGGLEARREEVAALLADPSGLGGGRGQIEGLSREFSDLAARIEALMARWEELESKR